MTAHVVILGGGIAGLTAAWWLKTNTPFQITLLEHSDSVGGWVRTAEGGGFLFECGPHSLRCGGSGGAVLELIKSLGLEQEIIVADKGARDRFLYYRGQLHPLPRRLWTLLFSPLLKRWPQAMWRDWQVPPGEREDESIASFFARHIGEEWVERFVDPFVAGIYAGDPRQLSMHACFPQMTLLEAQRGSLLKGLLRSHSRCAFPTIPGDLSADFPPSLLSHISGDMSFESSGVNSSGNLSGLLENSQREWLLSKRHQGSTSLISFRNGLETLIRRLAEILEGEIRLQTAPQSLSFRDGKVQVHLASGGVLEADHLISALPLPSLAPLLSPIPALDLPYASVAMVHLGYHRKVLKRGGFGYLIPKSEGESVLGCIWDSAVFPQQNHHPDETRLTVMLGGSQWPGALQLPTAQLEQLACEGVERHLGILGIKGGRPDYIQTHLAIGAIPQYPVGYLSQVQTLLRSLSPRLSLIGSAFHGVSLGDCVSGAIACCLPLLSLTHSPKVM